MYTPRSLCPERGRRQKSRCCGGTGGVELALGHDQRFYPVMAELTELIKEETLGPILHVETTLIHDRY